MAQASVLTDNEIRRVFRIIETSRHAITTGLLSHAGRWRSPEPRAHDATALSVTFSRRLLSRGT